MAKKDKVPTATEAAPLKHSPFAALLGRTADAALPTPVPARSHEQTRDEPKEASAAASQESHAPVARRNKLEGAAGAPSGKSRGRLVLRRETKHRAGKAVIVVSGFSALRDWSAADTDELARDLKKRLGCGGTVEQNGADAELVIQGDRAAQVAERLRQQGFRVEGVTK